MRNGVAWCGACDGPEQEGQDRCGPCAPTQTTSADGSAAWLKNSERESSRASHIKFIP